MRRLRRIAVVLMVWATAASTLLGSVPHVVCRCPNGKTKLFCVSLTSAKSGKSCCCGSSCCDKKASDGCCCKAKPTKKSCCVKENAEETDSGSKGTPVKEHLSKHGAAGGNCCQKTLVKTKVPVQNRSEVKVADCGCTSLILLANTAPGFAVAPAAPPKSEWRVDWSPPPPDLVTSLQRLTI